MRKSLDRRKILAGCIALSLFLHISSLLFLQGRSLWLSSSKPAKNGAIDAPWLSYIEKMERDQILKEAFEPQALEGNFLSANSAAAQLEPTRERESSLSLQIDSSLSPAKEAPLSLTLFQPAPFPQNQLLASNSSTLPSLPPSKDPFNLSDHLPKHLLLSQAPSELSLSTPPLLIASNAPRLNPHSLSAPLSGYSDIPTPRIGFSPLEFQIQALAENRDLPKAPLLVPVPLFPKLPTLADLETASYSESFDAEIVFLPREEGRGYLFAITLIPHADLELPRIRQHYTFLIDRSNSIQKDRLAATKNAVAKALEELFPDDTFNLIAFDNKLEKLSPSSLPCTPSSLESAANFLDKIQLGNFFSSSDPYKSLLPTVPWNVQNDEIYTAILLTDGETLSKKNIQRSLLFDWTAYNSGKVSLFTLGLESDPNLPSLDAASFFNKGKLTFAPTNRGIKRKLLKLMKTISKPVAKNLNCKAISRSAHSKIELFPKQGQMPLLYLNQPYILIGTVDTLDDFILFVQGRLKDRWINIKKTISFLNAKKGNQSLKSEWALQQAYQLYQQFFFDGDSTHLAEAGQLLEPYGYQTIIK